MKQYYLSKFERDFSIASIWIDVGSNMDKGGKRGLNHLLCTLLTRGCDGFDNFAFSNFIESYGAELNHEVFEDGITISFKSLNCYFNKIYPLIDLVINKPTLSEIQFQIVKNLTINSIKKEKENPFNACFNNWKRIVYLSHPYAFNSIGYEEDILNITYEDVLLEYKNFKRRKKYLISNNLEIKAEELKYQNHSDIHHCKKELYFIKNELSREKRFISTYKESNQIILMIGNQTCPRESNDHFPLKVLESHLSYGMSSTLFKKFRENNGITYDVGVFNSVRKLNAPFLIYLSVANNKALIAFQILCNIWNKLLFSLISDKEISLAKEKLKSSYLISNQSLDDILQRKIQLISYGINPNTYEDHLSEINKVSSVDILNVANKYFAKPFLSLTGEKGTCLDLKNQWINNF